MGEIADWLIEQEIDRYSNLRTRNKNQNNNFNKRAPSGYWRDATGSLHDIKQMNSQHIRNCLNMLTNKGVTKGARIYVELHKELMARNQDKKDS